jgi:hypothetical protein
MNSLTSKTYILTPKTALYDTWMLRYAIFYFFGGHLGFLDLADLARIFARCTQANFIRHAQMMQKQPSNLGPRKMVTESTVYDSTIYRGLQSLMP